jgi:hypothetical protein
MRPKSHPALMLSVLLTACTGDLTGSSPVLSGLWGGLAAEIEVSPTETLVRHDCFVTRYAGEIGLDRIGRFASEGTISWAAAPQYEGLTSRISGQRWADSITLVLAIRDRHGVWAKPDTFHLVPNQTCITPMARGVSSELTPEI